MNKELLLKLFHIPSQSGLEGDVANFITDFLDRNDIKYEMDEVGNIFNISHENKPLLSAHMDTVQDETDVMMAKFIHIRGDILKGYGVIGGDDKCGIYTILHLMENGHKDDFNFVFSVQEETGGIGIDYFTSNQDLSHITWGLVLDRKGNSDILCESHEYGTKEFENALLSIGQSFGFSIGQGTFSDADYLSDQISCANISVGYYNAHEKSEYVVLSELNNTINFIHYLKKHLDVIKFDSPRKTFSWARNSKSYGYYDYPDDTEFYDAYGQVKEVKVCDICGSMSDTVRPVKALGFNLCLDCKSDLFQELEGEFYYEIEYERYGGY